MGIVNVTRHKDGQNDDPIETAARALAKQQSGNADFDALHEGFQETLKAEVSAVLEALRDPAPGMAEAGAEIVRNVHEGESDAAFESDAANVWRFMFDAALSRR